MNEKITGYVLLLAGILILGYSALNMTRVMTGKDKPVQLFHFSGIGINPSQLLPQNLPDALRQQGQPVQLIQPEMINDTSNIAAHLVLMGFIATIGFRIGSLGVMLLRPVVVPVRVKEEGKDV